MIFIQTLKMGNDMFLLTTQLIGAGFIALMLEIGFLFTYKYLKQIKTFHIVLWAILISVAIVMLAVSNGITGAMTGYKFEIKLGNPIIFLSGMVLQPVFGVLTGLLT